MKDEVGGVDDDIQQEEKKTKIEKVQEQKNSNKKLTDNDLSKGNIISLYDI